MVYSDPGMPQYGQNNHLGQTRCALCREQAEESSIISTVDQAEATMRLCTRSPCPYCSRCPNPQVWWHKSCYGILAASYKSEGVPAVHDVEELGKASTPLYTSPGGREKCLIPLREGLFSDYTTLFLGSRFQYKLGKLPEEILFMILEYIGSCRYLTILGESRRLMQQLRNGGGKGSDRLSLSHGIYCFNIKYRGVSYVSRVSNLPTLSSSNGASAEEFLPIHSDTHKIVLSKDDMGVRNMQFLGQNSYPSKDGSPWYEVIELWRPISDTEMEFSYNGLFLRTVRLSSDQAWNTNVMWSSPCPPKFRPWNFYRVQDNSCSRLHHVRLDEAVKGLTVCCSTRGNVGIYPFSYVVTDYRDFVAGIKQKFGGRRIYWMYFPINRHESISEIWVRQFEGFEGPTSNPVIVFQTSQRRTVTFGPYVPHQSRSAFRFHSLVKPGDGLVSGLFHNGYDPGSSYISEIGVTCYPHCTGSTELEPSFDPYLPPPLPPRCSPFPYYMTKASLRGLTKVQYCRDNDSLHRPCIGLLLYYENGCIESLGQIRWDQELSDTILVPIRIQRGIEAGIAYVKNVQASKTPQCKDSEDDWLNIPEHGTLIWWFGHIGDQLVVYEK